MRRYWDSMVLAGALWLLGSSVTLILLWVPEAQSDAGGIVQKIFYFHVSSAWTAFQAFFLAAICGVCYLRKRTPFWDQLNYAAVEVGMVFCTMVLFTGPLWAKPVWGRYWSAEPRLITFTIMWFTYAALLVLRNALAGSERRAPISAVFSILASINVPLVYYSVRIFSVPQSHPGSVGLAPEMEFTLYVTLAAFTLLWISLTGMRYRIEKIKAEQDQRALQQAIGG